MRSNSHSYQQRYGREQPATRQSRHIGGKIAVLVVLLVIAVLAWHLHGTHGKNQTAVNTSAKSGSSVTPKTKKAPVAAASPPNACADNTLSQELLVSISKRHLWACAGSQQKYDSAVVTGMENLAADLTPVGVYHIYSKQTNLYLNGSDSTGSWHDYVYYWMPWLSNKYGVYGFHDATWRKPGDFGNISPYSSDASHGCVELPLATAKWVYNWAPVGTTVKIVS